MRPTPGRITSTAKRSWPASRPMSWPKRARQRRPTASRAGSSRCGCPATCRSCNMRTTARCAAVCTRLMPRARSDLGANPQWDNGPVDRAHSRAAPRSGDAAGLPQLRRGLAGAEDGAGLPPKSPRSCAISRGRAKPFARNAITPIWRHSPAKNLGVADLAPWDLAFATERLKAERYAFSEQEVRQYFPEDEVLAGPLPRRRNDLRRSHSREASAPIWHPAVRFFDITDRSGTLVGQFYFDLYAREGKQGGAWMDDAINRRRVGAHRCSIRSPTSPATCRRRSAANRRRSRTTKSSRSSTSSGMGCTSCSRASTSAGISGIQGVEWDAVELPSQFMENFCWEWDVLRAHDAARRTPANRCRAAFSTRCWRRRISRAEWRRSASSRSGLFDMLLHAEFDPVARTPWPSPQALLDAVRREVAVVPRAPYDRFMQAFSHIFAGGYAAGYYSYKWAEVLSADAYSLFEEQGVLSPAAGARFRDEVLARGGSRPALESFVAFRGRPPQLDALLRHNGMTVSL